MEELDSGQIPAGIELAARRLFYPKKWSQEHANMRPVVRHMIDCEGVTTADVKDMRYLPTHDVVVVRLRNGRKFPISGHHMFNTHP